MQYQNRNNGIECEDNYKTVSVSNQVEKNIEPEQLIRLKRSDSPMMRVISSNEISAQIKSDSGTIYTVTANACTCQDFLNRKKPCKHIYRYLIHTRKLNPFDYLDCYRDIDDIDKAGEDVTSRYSGDNMYLRSYTVKTLYFKTGKKRTVKLEAVDIDDIPNQIPEGYSKEGFTYTENIYNLPSERQVLYAMSLGLTLPERCCSIDASVLITNYLENDASAPIELIDFAKKMHINFSYYIGTFSLLRIIYNNLNELEKITLFIMCVNEYINKKWDIFNWNIYTDKAKLLSNNPQFINSYKRIHIDDFNKLYLYTRTNAFNLVKELLN